jgi:osmotically-inducible protein OsmY
VFRLSAPELGRWGRAKSPAEVALEETARAHLDADAVPFGANFGVEASRRFVILKGSLDALWQLELARQIVAEIAGVEDVIAEGVEITGPAQEDRATAKAIREVLRHAAGVDASTLAVAVRSGAATLTGSVRDKHEASRALALVRQVRGVRGVHDYLVVSETAKRRDKTLARRVRKALRTRYPDIPVNLTVFGNVAVLSGRVPRAAIRDQMKQLVSNQDGVERVVDKLNVSGRARRRR